MIFGCATISFFSLFQLFLPWLVACTEHSWTFEDCLRLEPTPQSIDCFTAHLKGGPSDSLIIDLQDRLKESSAHQWLCLNYLVSSVVVSGQVDEGALSVIHGLCGEDMDVPLLDLSGKLIRKNDVDTAARFVAENAMSRESVTPLGKFVIVLMEKDWNVMRVLAVRILATLKDDDTANDQGCRILRYLPAELQYEAISTGRMSLSILDAIYSFEEFDPLLREVFALARCSYSPSPQLRRDIASLLPCFEQFLPDCTTGSIMIPCPDNIPQLTTDEWLCIFAFSDVETLLFVLPLVCSSWRNLQLRILTDSTEIHKLYLQDLGCVEHTEICRIAPWKYFLLNETDALRYLGWCLMSDAFRTAESKWLLQEGTKRYLEAVACGRLSLPKAKNGTAQYDAFLRLFEKIHAFCSMNEPVLRRPTFFTNAEYERLIRYLICERGLILSLYDLLIHNDIPNIFRIIDEDEELMMNLIDKNYEDLVRPSIILILYGQTNDVPKGLTESVLSQTGLFEEFFRPELIHSNEYYEFIVEFDILPRLMVNRYWTTAFYQLVASIILAFRNNPGKVEKFVASMADWFRNSSGRIPMYLKQRFREGFTELFKDTEKYPPEDIGLIERATTKLGWLEV